MHTVQVLLLLLCFVFLQTVSSDHALSHMYYLMKHNWCLRCGQLSGQSVTDLLLTILKTKSEADRLKFTIFMEWGCRAGSHEAVLIICTWHQQYHEQILGIKISPGILKVWIKMFTQVLSAKLHKAFLLQIIYNGTEFFIQVLIFCLIDYHTEKQNEMGT